MFPFPKCRNCLANKCLQVLGCCIVLVFCLGMIKLWWTNQTVRKWETLDAEKRARSSVLSSCGIEAWKVGDVPFGVRAIQRGVEVDGIWIAHPDSGNLGKPASSANTISYQTDHLGRTGRGTERGIFERLRESSTSERTEGSGNAALSPTWSRTLPTAGQTCLDQALFDLGERQDAIDASLESHLDSYIPSGAQIQSLPDQGRRAPTATTQPVRTRAHAPVMAQPVPLSAPTLNGAARIHANRDIRRPNQDFEILPAGALGPRQELQVGHCVDSEEGSERDKSEYTKPNRRRLRKKPPVPEMRQERDIQR